MALRAGLPLRDMEMVQFHPTGLLAGEGTRMTGTVLEEGLRGAGGHLLNGSEHRFMFDYHEGGERATRDIVSRAHLCRNAEIQHHAKRRRLYLHGASGAGECGQEIQRHGQALRRLRV